MKRVLIYIYSYHDVHMHTAIDRHTQTMLIYTVAYNASYHICVVMR